MSWGCTPSGSFGRPGPNVTGRACHARVTKPKAQVPNSHSAMALRLLSPSLHARALSMPTTTADDHSALIPGDTSLARTTDAAYHGTTDAPAQQTGSPTCPICHRERKEHHRLGFYWQKFGYAGPEYCTPHPHCCCRFRVAKQAAEKTSCASPPAVDHAHGAAPLKPLVPGARTKLRTTTSFPPPQLDSPTTTRHNRHTHAARLPRGQALRAPRRSART